MAWLAVNRFNREYIYEEKPKRCYCCIWAQTSLLSSAIELPKGSIERLIGRELSWKDEPVELSNSINSIKIDNMVKYKVGDIFINHNDGKILQVCKGRCDEGCCYRFVGCKGIFSNNVPCKDFIGCQKIVKALPSLPIGTKVKIREDLKVGTRYGRYTFVDSMVPNKEVTIKNYSDYYRAYDIVENSFSYSFEMFDQVINEPKENNMETREIKIKVPEGYEIDEENSALDCIKFKPIKKKELTYNDMADKLFNNTCYYTNRHGEIVITTGLITTEDRNNATNKEQLERLMALNQLLNIAEYYNKKSPKEEKKIYCINFDKRNLEYFIQDYTSSIVMRGLVPKFNNKEDAKAVINNPNFKNILDLVYKGNED